MIAFISGGAKNGKSTFAQNLAVKLAGGGPLYYIATMVATDEEDEERIRRHKRDREGLGFITIEQPRDITKMLCGEEEKDEGEGERKANDKIETKAPDPSGTFLLDSVTALLSNVMFPPGGEFNLKAGEEVAEDLTNFIKAIKSQKGIKSEEGLGESGNIVFVSDYIYSEAKVFDEWTEKYRRALAFVDRRLAQESDAVIEIAAGIPKWHKGVGIEGLYI